MKLSQSRLLRYYLITFVIVAAYLAFFFFVESLELDYHYLHHPLDDLIPFHELAFIPYASWFIYISFTLLVFAHLDPDKYLPLLALIFGGMTICLFINILYPTAVNLRPEVLPRDNILTDMVRQLHVIDTPTNVCPSIHAYATIICHLALTQISSLRKKPVLHVVSWLLCISICLSIVFLKQHSVIDLFWGAVVAVLFWFIFRYFYNKSSNTVSK